MPERLDAHGISWKVYQTPLTGPTGQLSNNVLAFFRQYQDSSTARYRNAFQPSFPGEFELDALAGTLPQVSWVLAPPGTDEHPPGPPTLGESMTALVLSSLTANPAVWGRTALFVTHDENGGFFDHVAPPTAPPGTAGEYLPRRPLPSAAGGVGGPVGLGFRVPMLVVSPFSRGGFVNSDPFDHTSLLRFIETRFGVEVPNLSKWRRGVTGDLTSTLDLAHPHPSVPTLAQPNPRVLAECASVLTNGGNGAPYPQPATQHLPRQERGPARRRRR
jgi:phospholipase C